MKKIALFVFLGVLACQTLAQERPFAAKIDSYTGSHVEHETLMSKTQQFLAQIASAPKGTRAAILFDYKYMFEGDCLTGKMGPNHEAENFVRKVVSVDSTVVPESIIYVPGSLSVRHQVEFWLVPAGVKVPEPAPLDFDPPCCCPIILIVGKPIVKAGTKRVKFVFWVGNGEPLTNVKYKWTVSNGTIVTGQGTTEIEVAVGNEPKSEVNATVEAEGVNPPCNCAASASYATKIVP